MNIDCKDFLNYPPTEGFYKQLVHYPEDVIILTDMACNAVYTELFPDEEPTSFQVRPFNLKKIHNMRDLDPIDIDNLISIRGMIIRCSSIIPDLTTGYFRCTNCGNGQEVAIDRGRIVEPTQCEKCQSKVYIYYILLEYI